MGIVFAEIKPTKDVQKNIYDILKETIGEKYADYLVYSDDGTIEELEKEINAGDTTYELSRSIANEEGFYRISFALRVAKQGFTNKLAYYSENYQPLYNDIKFKIENVFTNSTFGSTNPFSFLDFLDDYMKLGIDDIYVSTYPNQMGVQLTKINNLEITHVFIDVQKGCEQMGEMSAPSTHIEYTVYEKDGVVDDIETSVSGGGSLSYIEDGEDKATAYSRIVALEQEQIKAIIGDIDFTGLGYTDIEDGGTAAPVQKRTISLAGKDVEVSIPLSSDESMSNFSSGKFQIYRS